MGTVISDTLSESHQGYFFIKQFLQDEFYIRHRCVSYLYDCVHYSYRPKNIGVVNFSLTNATEVAKYAALVENYDCTAFNPNMKTPIDVSTLDASVLLELLKHYSNGDLIEFCAPKESTDPSKREFPNVFYEEVEYSECSQYSYCFYAMGYGYQHVGYGDDDDYYNY